MKKEILFFVVWLIGAFILDNPRILWGVTFLLLAMKFRELSNDH